MYQGLAGRVGAHRSISRPSSPTGCKVTKRTGPSTGLRANGLVMTRKGLTCAEGDICADDKYCRRSAECGVCSIVRSPDMASHLRFGSVRLGLARRVQPVLLLVAAGTASRHLVLLMRHSVIMTGNAGGWAVQWKKKQRRLGKPVEETFV